MEQTYALSNHLPGLVGILLASVFLIWGAYKQIGALPLMVGGSLIVVLSNGMPLWNSFAVGYMEGYLGFFRNLFLVFGSSTVYTKVMEETGSIIKVGYKLSEWFGPKRAMLVVFTTTALLTYGGVSLFVVVLAVAPLIMVLFKQANLPRSLAVAPLAAGAITFTMKSLPGSPQATNVVPTDFLGTDLNAAVMLGLFSAAIMIATQIWYFSIAEKKVRATGEGFTFIPGTKEENYLVDQATLPSTFKAFLPLVVVVASIIILSFMQRNGHIDIATNAIVVASMLFTTTLALLLNLDKIRDIAHVRYILNDGAMRAVTAIAGPAAVAGFGGVVRASPAFAAIVNSLLNMDMNPYGMAAFGASVIGGVVGSSSAGLLISLEVLAEPLLATGANPEYLHRIASTFAGTFDSLPHSTIWFLVLPTLGVTHKEGYKHAFWTTVILPTIAGLAMLAVVFIL